MAPTASTLPVDIWSIVFKYLTAPLTQFIGSPTAAATLDRDDQIYAKEDLLHAAHVDKAAYIAARPFLYGNLYLFLRANPTTFDLPKPERLEVEESTNHSALADSQRLNYFAHRAQHHAARSIFARVCCAKCTYKHEVREKSEKVNEVPELYPFVVRGGKLYLPSLLANESEATRTPEAIGKSLASLLGGVEDGEVTQVEIVDGLVLIPYPLHLVAGLHIHTGDVSITSWLATSKDRNDESSPIFTESASAAAVAKDHHDWAAKLPFILALPMQRITSFTLIVHDEEHDSAFATLCGDLFRAYPHIRTLDIVSKFEYHYSFPAEFPSRAQHVAVYPYSRGSWEEHYDTLPMALFRTDLRHLEVYGSHSFIFKHWQHVFNHPTLTSLVTEFTYNSADQDPQRLSDFSAPALTSWTTNHGFAYVVFNDDLLPPIDQPIFTALQELALVYADWEYHSAMSIPKGYSQVPEIPFGRLPTLRKFSVLGKHSGEYVWINMKAKVLIDLLSLPNIHHLSLPNVSPYFVTPLAPTSIYCHSLTTLDINVNMFVDMLPSVVLPNITSLTLHTTYFPEPEHQLSPAMWQQIHDRWGTQLVHFGYRRIGFELETSPTCTFPTDLAFSNLHSIDMFTCIGTVDLMHVAAFAPNLNKAKIDADHAANLPALLAHPKLTHLELAGPRCPTMLEALLAHPPPKTLGLSLIPRAVTNLYGEHSSAIGHVCERTSVTLTYDRDHNWNVWRTLLRSENLGKLRHWVIRKGDNDMGDGDSDGYVENEWHATLVVHADLGPREARNIGRVVGQVLGEWDAVKVQVGVKDCAGHSEPTFLERLSEAVNEEHPSASVEWVGAITGEHDGWAVCGCDEK